MPAFLTEADNNGRGALRAQGAWTVFNAEKIRKEIKRLRATRADIIDMSEVETLDTAGAFLAQQAADTLGAKMTGLGDAHRTMFALLNDNKAEVPPKKKPLPPITGALTVAGQSSLSAARTGREMLEFIGETAVTFARCLTSPSYMRFDSIARHIREAGINAVPIVMLIAFLISVVLAYQGAEQLKRFGAEIFTINMVAVSILREMGVLLTAIMVAGRSGSAFTAEIGVMKINEEVDAMRVMGLSPFEVLVVPRFIALLIALPALTLVADIMGAIGGGLVLNILLNVSLVQYVELFGKAVDASDFWVGIVKAPFFAFAICVVGCMRGMQVSGSAESLGRLTTISVVHSIFLVLLMDALFSILFTKIGW